ncbi:MAG: SGNH/GDSL hydrolase family protein, partial [Candidatus Kaelpia aquatica]|nr:SGNH/GDSL hydrolase family protein [Candidatus Kaelpia aquatica]
NSSDIKKEFKIFNFGYPGYSSLQGLLFLKKYIAQLKPDCVIVWFGANDRCFAPFYSDKEFYTRNNKNLKITKIHNFLYNNLKFYRLVRNINLNYFRKIVDKSFNNPAERNYTKIRVSRSDFLKNLQEIKEMCLKNNSRVIFIEYCWYINDNLNRYERNNPIKPYIKLYDVYQAGEDKIHNYFLDQVHPSKLGHQLIAQKLSKEIEQLILRK